MRSHCAVGGRPNHAQQVGCGRLTRMDGCIDIGEQVS